MVRLQSCTRGNVWSSAIMIRMRPAWHSGRCRYSNQSRGHDPLRILFCGSGPFSIDSLRALESLRSKSSAIESIDVLCREDKRVGRGLTAVQEGKFTSQVHACSRNRSLPILISADQKGRSRDAATSPSSDRYFYGLAAAQAVQSDHCCILWLTGAASHTGFREVWRTKRTSFHAARPPWSCTYPMGIAQPS